MAAVHGLGGPSMAAALGPGGTDCGGIIKTSGSESRGQEEAVCTRISGLRDHYSELFTRMVGLNF